MRRFLLGDTFKAKLAAVVFLYEAVALGIGPCIRKRLSINVPPLTDIAIKHPFGTGTLMGILSFHLHIHYRKKIGTD